MTHAPPGPLRPRQRATSRKPATKTAVPQQKSIIPSGTVLLGFLIDSLGSDTNTAGDRFLAGLAEPVVVEGHTRLGKGTKVRGRVVSVEDSGRVKGRASIRLTLTDILLGNRTISITTDTFTARAESSTKRDAGVIGGGAAIGAAIGAIAGGKKGAGIGAIAGGGAGTGAVLGTRGKHLMCSKRDSYFAAKPISLFAENSTVGIAAGNASPGAERKGVYS